ncbi:MAG: zinc ABC transporter substrate-binding protein [Patescibacteria group bacterium]|jgi:zinc transport system substrate-binding protein
MKKLLITILPVLIIAGGWIAYAVANQPAKNQNKLTISASFYPYAYLAKQIGGDLVDVKNITPAGAEPHDFEPSAGDIVQMYQSKLFIYNGLVESWGDKLAGQLKSENVVVLKMSDQVNLAVPNDPHFWLDPVLVKQQASLIRDRLVEIDWANASIYDQNALILQSKLTSLNTQYQNGLNNCQITDFVTAHDAFAYLAKRYDLNQIAISGISPDSEPSAQQMAEISNLVTQKQIEYIFFESLTSPKLSETIASATGAKTLVLNPLEGLTTDQEQSGQDYVTIMQDNLTNLRVALGCK